MFITEIIVIKVYATVYNHPLYKSPVNLEWRKDFNTDEC